MISARHIPAAARLQKRTTARSLWLAGWLLCLFSGLLFARDEYQFRPESHLTVQAATNLKVQVGIQGRLNEDGVYEYQHTEMGLAYTGLAPWMDVSLNYRLIFEKLTEENWSYATLPSLNATVRFPIHRLKFSNRLRLEYTTMEDLSDFGMVRNKITLNPPIYLETARERHFLGAQKVHPYLSYELFYTVNSGVISRHRYQGGLSVRFSARVIGELYYTRQETDEGTEFEGLNIIGLNMSLLF
jgi:Protein of unknown function (DUF2490)